MEKYFKPVYPSDGEKGLTKREYFAGIFMQSMLSSPEYSKYGWDHIADLAVTASVALIDELECE